MKKIFIIGNTAAAAKSAEWIRQHDQESSVTLISTDAHYPYDANRLSEFLGGEIPQKDLLIKPKDYYAKNNITVLLDKKISKINLKRSRIFTEAKDQWEFDILILTDLPDKKFPDMKGSNKEGIYHLRSFPQVDLMLKKLLVTETIAVQSDTFEGLKTAYAIAKKGKEVIFFASNNSFILKGLAEEPRRNMMESLSSKGMHIILVNEITEILGDSDVKAVRLKSGKVLAAQMVVFEDMREDWRIFSENELQVTNRFEVNEFFETSIRDVYALSTLAKQSNMDLYSPHVIPTSFQYQEAQAAVAKIVGKEIAAAIPDPVKSIVLEDMTITPLGLFKESVSV